MVEISREYVIQAAHHLPMMPDGHKCKRPHGHTWEVRVWVDGPIHPVTNLIIDYAELDELWGVLVHDRLDHRNLNDVIPNPTTENIVQWIWATLQNHLSNLGLRVFEIVVTEGGNGAARIRVPGPR